MTEANNTLAHRPLWLESSACESGFVLRRCLSQRDGYHQPVRWFRRPKFKRRRMPEHMKTRPALLKVLSTLRSHHLLIRFRILRTMDSTCLRSPISWQQREPRAVNNRFRPPQHEAIRCSRSVGCAVCHTRTFVTAAPGTLINGGAFAVPAALGNKIIHPVQRFCPTQHRHRGWNCSKRRTVDRQIKSERRRSGAFAHATGSCMKA